MSDAVISLRGVRAFYGQTAVLHDVDLEVAPRSIVALLGANGAGKSTLLKTIMNSVRRSGTIRFSNDDTEGRSTRWLVRAGVTLVPEGRGTFARLTVDENLRIGARTGATRDAMDSVYEHFPVLYRRQKQLAGSLSGGEQQMLAVGRGLMSKPRVLLVDEMSLGLAPRVAMQILAVLKSLNEQTGLAVLLVEQNARLALPAADYAYILNLGRVVAEGVPGDIERDDVLRSAYLGY